MRNIELPNGRMIPKMGQGTWFIGDDPGKRGEEIDASRIGVERGLTLIGTSEMYGHGRAEALVGEAISDCRDDVFLASKVSPGANRSQTIEACEQSLERLGTDYLDLYLLHGVDSNTVFDETIAGFDHLVTTGLIRQ